MNQSEIYQLLERYKAGTATDEELALLETWYLQQAAKPSALTQADVNTAESIMAAHLKKHIGAGGKVKLWPRYIGIAAAVIGLAICIYFFSAPRHLDDRRDLLNYTNDIAPGKNTALLVVNGKQTQLSDAKLGIVVNDDIKYNDGTKLSSSALDINNPSSRANAKDLALEVITPKGGTYSIILQDGTKVWLNADSKLEVLPNFWNKTQRLVRLTGEGYFEVAKVFSPGKAGRGPELIPFIVESNGQRVEVLGTHFNVSAYKGEAIKTTLLEGSVIVSSLRGGTTKQPPLEIAASRKAPRNDGKGVTLKPNQQSLITENGSITVTQADPNATAWKNGKFKFRETTLEDVMKQLARWYDVEVVYPDGIPDKKFTGGINRNVKLSETLTLLNYTKLKFTIEGKQIIVRK